MLPLPPPVPAGGFLWHRPPHTELTGSPSALTPTAWHRMAAWPQASPLSGTCNLPWALGGPDTKNRRSGRDQGMHAQAITKEEPRETHQGRQRGLSTRFSQYPLPNPRALLAPRTPALSSHFFPRRAGGELKQEGAVERAVRGGGKDRNVRAGVSGEGRAWRISEQG